MITTITGMNTFLVQQELNQRTGEFVKAHGDLALERLDGEESSFERITEALQSLPFLATNKLVVIKNPAANKEFAEQFEQLITTIPDNTDVILVEARPDKRTVFYKLLKKLTEFHEFAELPTQALPRWLADEAKNRGGSLSTADANYLVQRVGANQLMLSNELDKLLAYQPVITHTHIDQLTDKTPQSTIFELLDAAFAGDTKQAMSLYKEQRALKVEPQQIMAMLAWQLHVLALIKAAGEKSIDDIAREAKLNPFVVRKTAGIARKVTLKEVKRLVHDALELDIRLKTESIDADDALQHYLLTISS